MTNSTISPAGTRNWPAYAVASVGLATVLSALAFYVDVFGPVEEGPDDPVWSWLIVVAVVGAIAAVVFGLVVRTATPANADPRGLIVALVGIPSVWAFWAGLPVVFAAAATCLALSKGRPSKIGMVTLALALAEFGFCIWGALAG